MFVSLAESLLFNSRSVHDLCHALRALIYTLSNIPEQVTAGYHWVLLVFTYRGFLLTKIPYPQVLHVKTFNFCMNALFTTDKFC